MIVCGCDLGARAAKVVLLEDNSKIIGSSIVPFTRDPLIVVEQALEEAMKKANLSRGDIKYIMGTGFGNVHIPFAQELAQEMICHAKGAHQVMPSVRTVIDIGGMDCKVILITDKGDVENFAQNDKCASGTGRFLEDMAGVLFIKLEDLGELSKQSTQEVKITNQCSVFALSEVISLVALKVAVPDIIAGLHDSIANRVTSMVHRLGMVEKVTLSGGVTKNIGMLSALEKKLGVKLELAMDQVDHQLFGALGAALIAKTKL